MPELQSYLIVALTVLVVVLLERTRSKPIQVLLQWLPAILFAYIVPATVTHLFGLDLSGVGLHQVSRDFIMPLAIVLVMSALSFAQLKSVGWRPILVFVSGSAAVAILPILLLWLAGSFSPSLEKVLIDDGYWRGLVTVVGSWVGGSTSQLVLKELVACPEDIFLVILVMDNVLVNLWTILMFQKIKISHLINKKLGIDDQSLDFVPDQVQLQGPDSSKIVQTAVICLAAVVICLLWVPSFLLKIVLLSIAGLLFGNFLAFWNHAFVIKAGGYLIITIMAILGLKLDFTNFGIPASVVLFAAVWLIGHYVVMMLMAYLLRLNMAWVPIASMANVGGVSTAPAVTKAYNEEWMPHAILLAILSMVTGTYWGMLTISLFELFW